MRISKTCLLQELFSTARASQEGFKWWLKYLDTQMDLNNNQMLDLGPNFDCLTIMRYGEQYSLSCKHLEMRCSDILTTIRRVRLIRLYRTEETSKEMPLSRFIHLLEKVDDL